MRIKKRLHGRQELTTIIGKNGSKNNLHGEMIT